MVLGTLSQFLDDISLLLNTKPALARVLARGEPGGSPDPLFLDLPWMSRDARLEQVGLLFTTADGQEVTAAVGRTASLPWRPLQAGAQIPVRYDPADPSARPTLRRR
jgi:hypothetical protein